MSKPLYISVDVEADGPIPGEYSMIQIGACVVGDESKTFIGNLRPISDLWVPEALAVSGYTREETLTFDPATVTMRAFESWLIEQRKNGNLMFVSDNAVFDGMFVFWYFHKFLGRNPFGFSGTSITSLYKGHAQTMKASFKHLRTRKHTHNALDDAIGNAGAFAKILELMEEASREREH